MPSISFGRDGEEEEEEDTVPFYEDPVFDSVPLEERLAKGIGHFFEIVLQQKSLAR